MAQCRGIVFCGIAALLVSAGAALAAGPAALIVDVTGGTIAAAPPYSEIQEGATVTVPPGVRLVFQHYASCRRVAVLGGSVAFTSDGYAITGGTKESDVKVACPRKVTMRTSGEAAGVLLRSTGASLTLSTRPAVVLTGPRADDIKIVRILKGDDVVLEVPLDTRVFRWPATAAPLSTGTIYQLQLVPSTAGTAPVSMRFATPRAAASPGDETFTLIAVE